MTEPLKTQRESLAFNYRPTFGVCNLFAEFFSQRRSTEDLGRKRKDINLVNSFCNVLFFKK